jgi:ABC-type nickel/cobalt efflux system permease component RcnA
VVAVAALAVVPAAPASAHPLGNFTVNLFSGLRVEPDRMLIDLVVDMAEIPTFQVRRDIDGDGDGAVGAGEQSTYATRACREAAGRIDVTVDGRAVPVRPGAGDVTFPAGTGGLPTLRLTCSLAAELGAGAEARQLFFRNRNYEERVGWREIVAVGDRTTLASSTVPTTTTSARLTSYPDDLLQSPPDQRSATLTVHAGGPPAVAGPADQPSPPPAPAVETRGLDRFSRSFTELVARHDLTIAFALLAVGLAVVLGAVHALAPGHGKTLMAAYLLGGRGSSRDAWLIGATMVVTHTAGVLALGVLLSASTTLAAETVYPWLGLVSGLLLASIGANLLYRSVRPALGHPVTHAHPHPHSHPDPETAPFGWQGLVGMGLVGGLLPSPSALVVLLGAIALGRAWFGVLLVGAYGIGMAGTLLGTGLLLARAGAGFGTRLGGRERNRLGFVARAVPALTAVFVLGAGLFFAAQGATRI